MPIFILFLPFILILFGCNSPDPNPELKDPIYMDIHKQEQTTQADLKAEENALIQAQLDLSKTKPQTGQVKYAQKKVYEIESRISKIKQTLAYLEIRKKSRELYSRKSYMKSFLDKTPWPNPNEINEYKVHQRLEQAPRHWNVKQRLLDASLVNKKKSGSKPQSNTSSSN